MIKIEKEYLDNSSDNFLQILKDNVVLNVKCFKWLHHHNNRKYDEMFDYDTEQFRLSEYNIKKEGTIIDNFKMLKFIDNNSIENNEEMIDENKVSYGSHFNSNRNFLKENMVIYSNTKNQFNKEFVIKYNKYSYLVCKYLKDESTLNCLNIGSFLRIGKYILKVLVLKIQEELKFYKSSKVVNRVEETDEEPTCRFCFRGISKNNLLNDRLITVCNCKGTLKYIHPNCLSTWIKNKCDINYNFINPNFFKIRISNFYCEICNKTFPLITKDTKDEYYFLLEILKYKNNFIVLKNILIQDEKTVEKIKEDKDEKLEYVEYLYIELSNYYQKHIIFGRDKKCDVILDDISVSRKHCQMYIDKTRNNLLRVKDLDSKFGTLINMQDDIIIDEIHPDLTLQKGNTVYHFKLKNIFI